MSDQQADNVDEQELATCIKWLRTWAGINSVKAVRFESRYSSYTFKHVVENWSGVYVSNEAFIRAALIEGYSGQAVEEEEQNFIFNIKIDRWKKHLKKEHGWKTRMPISGCVCGSVEL